MIKLGIDNGNYNTKSSDGMLYASGYTASDREFITPEMQLYYDGRYYAIGERRLRFQQDKTTEPDTFILTLPAIAAAMCKAGLTTWRSPSASDCPSRATERGRTRSANIFYGTISRSSLRISPTAAGSRTAKSLPRGTPRFAAIIPG